MYARANGVDSLDRKGWIALSGLKHLREVDGQPARNGIAIDLIEI